MAILTDKLLILHIPKTGGSWVQTALRKAGVPWVNTGKAHSTLEKLNPGGRMTACFTRDPKSWLGSYYRWSHKTGRFTSPNGPFTGAGLEADTHEIDPYGCNSEHQFINSVPIEAVTRFMARYVKDCDFVGRTEHLEDDLVRLLALAGHQFNETTLRNTPRVNVTKL